MAKTSFGPAEELQLPEQFPDFSSVSYWEARYSADPKAAYDWLVPYSSLRSILLPRIQTRAEAEILILGCGNSRLGEELYKDGFRNITNLDFSPTVIDQMSARYSVYSEMDFMPADVCDPYDDTEVYDIIIDKATLDCVLTGENSFQRAGQLLQNACLGLKEGGVYCLVSHGMPDTRVGYLKGKALRWSIEHTKIAKTRLEQFTGLEASQSHYVYICTKYAEI